MACFYRAEASKKQVKTCQNHSCRRLLSKEVGREGHDSQAVVAIGRKVRPQVLLVPLSTRFGHESIEFEAISGDFVKISIKNGASEGFITSPWHRCILAFRGLETRAGLTREEERL